jgi:hypothetical protein
MDLEGENLQISDSAEETTAKINGALEIQTPEDDKLPAGSETVIDEILNSAEIIPAKIQLLEISEVEQISDDSDLANQHSDENSEIARTNSKEDKSKNSEAESFDLQIIRDIEAELDERIEQLSKQSTDTAENGTNVTESDSNQDKNRPIKSEDVSEFDDDTGTTEMCSEEENNFRLEHDLVHKLEMTDGVPDRHKIVTEYRRPAADCDMKESNTNFKS